jgi:hypothetical protein
MTWFRQRFAPGYDLFKLLVAVILVILLIVLLLRSLQAGLTAQVAITSTSVSTATSNPTLPATETFAPVLISSPQPDTPTPTFTLQPVTPTETPFVPTATSTPLPSTSEPTQLVDSGCPSAQSRIKIGDTVRVLLRLNFREGPGLGYPIIQTNLVGTTMQVIDGPICTVRTTSEGPRAYLWWHVRMENGMEGWSAEAPLINSFYFLDPVK